MDPRSKNRWSYSGALFYKPGHVRLKPSILKDAQDAVEKVYGRAARFDLVFHGGAGSLPEKIHEAIDCGVVKMNIDTDTQYAFTRVVTDHMLKNYDGVLKVDGEVGNKNKYDPRTYLAAAEAAMAERVKAAVTALRGAGTTLCTGPQRLWDLSVCRPSSVKRRDASTTEFDFVGSSAQWSTRW
jgi:fructose-bisphosphate aldolase class II